MAAAGIAKALLAVAATMEQRHREHGIRCPGCGELAFEAELPRFTSLIDFMDTS